MTVFDSSDLSSLQWIYLHVSKHIDPYDSNDHRVTKLPVNH